MANEVYTTAETNLIKAAQMSKAREVDFVARFTHNSLNKLIEVLGVTRKIPMMEGTTMYVYATSGTLQSGSVAEGDIIPLSQYATTKTAIGEITLKKWRKAVSAEAIKKSGYEAAVRDTDRALLRDVQKGIRTDFFTLLNGTITGSTSATGVGLQAALANAWGKLQVNAGKDAYVGTNMSYAKYHEMGTGIYVGGGRSSPWAYPGADGEWHWTRGVSPIHFIKNAVADNVAEYRQIFLQYLGKL